MKAGFGVNSYIIAIFFVPPPPPHKFHNILRLHKIAIASTFAVAIFYCPTPQNFAEIHRRKNETYFRKNY